MKWQLLPPADQDTLKRLSKSLLLQKYRVPFAKIMVDKLAIVLGNHFLKKHKKTNKNLLMKNKNLIYIQI